MNESEARVLYARVLPPRSANLKKARERHERAEEGKGALRVHPAGPVRR